MALYVAVHEKFEALTTGKGWVVEPRRRLATGWLERKSCSY